MRQLKQLLVLTVLVLLLPGAAMPGNVTVLETELRAAETAFATTMANRDLEAFTQCLSEEAVFFTGDTTLRGRQAVADAWAPYFEGEVAPFSWRPEAVSVLDSGTLGFSSGPVLDPEGERVGTFNSVWRRTADGHWEIIFDRGCPPCGGD